MKEKKIMAMPVRCFYAVIGILLIGIVIGSFFDFEISVKLAGKTKLGSVFATCGSYFSYCLYPAAGTCLYLGLKKKNRVLLGKVLLCASYFITVYYTNSYSGSKLREIFGYSAGESSPWLSALCLLVIMLIYIWVPLVCRKIFDDGNPDKLIRIGCIILISGVLADNVNLWLKQVASRPRYKYLLTLENPASEFRNWWEMVPNLAGNNDNFKSWPSGNMSIAAMMFSLPMLFDITKKASKKGNVIAFIIACVFVLLYAYNRIHMTNHFLSDVCFGTLFCYLIYGLTARAFEKNA